MIGWIAVVYVSVMTGDRPVDSYMKSRRVQKGMTGSCLTSAEMVVDSSLHSIQSLTPFRSLRVCNIGRIAHTIIVVCGLRRNKKNELCKVCRSSQLVDNRCMAATTHCFSFQGKTYNTSLVSHFTAKLTIRVLFHISWRNLQKESCFTFHGETYKKSLVLHFMAKLTKRVLFHISWRNLQKESCFSFHGETYKKSLVSHLMAKLTKLFVLTVSLRQNVHNSCVSFGLNKI